MKKRIKIDGFLLTLVGMITLCFYQYPVLYLNNLWLDNFLDIVGLFLIIKGVFFRMSARGHKKNFSLQGKGLVTTGIYGYIRNPMYFGSFLIGGGFVLLLWPWWTFPIYTFFFYQRFKQQVDKEEDHLTKVFGAQYKEYCLQVPPIIPTPEKIRSFAIKDLFPWDELWSTKEKWLLLGLPLCAILLELLQQKVLFNVTEFLFLMYTSLTGIFLFCATFFYHFLKYRKLKPRA